MYRFIYQFFIFSLILITVSCSTKNSVAPNNNENSPDNDVSSENVYADEEELNKIASQYQSETVLNWKMARLLAFDELYILGEEKSWQDATISKTPIIIYDSDLKPKYYEFRVIKDNNEVGTITANIFPVGGAIAYVLDDARNYSVSTKTRMGGNSKVIDDNYPNVGFSLSLSRTGSVNKVMNLNGEPQNVTNFYDNLEEFVNDVGGVEKAADMLGVNEEDIYTSIDERKNKERQLENDFILMNEALPNVENLTDDEIKKLLNSPLQRGIKRARSNIISTYSKIATSNYRFANYNCGSAALAWIYAGINKYYDGYYVLNNPDKFTATLEGLLETGDSGVTLPSKFDGAIKNITGNAYGFKTSKFIFGNTHNHMKTSQLPVLSLRGSRWNSLSWHYRVIYGMIWTNEEHRFLWWKWSRDHSFKYYMHDNGADGPSGVFIESSWNSGFWHQKVVKN